MLNGRRPWEEELAIIDRVMRQVSGITEPEEMVNAYWDGISELLPTPDYVAVSLRGVEPPFYIVTRSSRFTESINPWTQRERLPKLSGGILGEIAYAGKPAVITDLTARLNPDDPAHFYLQGFQTLVAMPQYDAGRALNISAWLFEPGVHVDLAMVPMMHWQSSLFGRGTQNLVLRNQLATALANLDRELQVVAEIQRSLLPVELPRLPGFECAAFYQTSAQAGGDYYDFFPFEHGQCGIFIADVSGHGTPAAVLMAITHAIAHTRPGAPKPPAEILSYLNGHLCRSYTRSGAFITGFYGVLDPATRRLTYASAGHNPPRLCRGGRVMALDEAGGLPLGIAEDERYLDATVVLEPGDLLVLYTDGITEAMPPKATRGGVELFGTARLDAILLDGASTGTEGVVKAVREAVVTFAGGVTPRDDQTMLAIRCL